MYYNPLKHIYRRFNWQDIWEKKGREDTKDLKQLDGYGSSSKINLKFIANKISKELQLKPSDIVLEIGCGAGVLSQFLKCDYYGIDYSDSLISKYRKLVNKGTVELGHANLLYF